MCCHCANYIRLLRVEFARRNFNLGSKNTIYDLRGFYMYRRNKSIYLRELRPFTRRPDRRISDDNVDTLRS